MKCEQHNYLSFILTEITQAMEKNKNYMHQCFINLYILSLHVCQLGVDRTLTQIASEQRENVCVREYQFLV